MTLFLLLVSLIVVNLLEWGGRFQIYQPFILIVNLTSSLLMSGMVANLGILISLRSRSVQSAAQTIMLTLFMPFILLQAVVFLLPTFIPRETVHGLLERFDLISVLLVVFITFVVLNIGLFFGANARFNRSRLIFP